jgi:hypothetical protein
MSKYRRPKVLGALLAAAIVASWAFAPSGARAAKPISGPALAALTGACEQALRARLPSRPGLRLAGPPRIEAAGGGAFRLLSSFESSGTRTAFACEAVEEGGRYEVAGLTVVHW